MGGAGLFDLIITQSVFSKIVRGNWVSYNHDDTLIFPVLTFCAMLWNRILHAITLRGLLDPQIR